ncbi:MAG: hypothetical protein U0Y68_20365 [Blastocatellia bacterium]
MFCPSCGSDQSGQYCRSCGKDLRAVRTAIEKPDTSAKGAAQQEIARAVAEKIRELDGVHDLKKVVEDVLPQVTKFLESPEESRLRRIRSGTITAAIGAGATIAFFALAVLTNDAGLMFPAGAGLVTFLIGLGLMLNGWYFTLPKKETVTSLPEMLATTEHTPAAPERALPASVTDHTTQHLPEHLARTRNPHLE